MTAEPRDLFATPETVNKRLVLVDGMALVYRSHFALISNPRFTSTGLCTSAVLGFCNTLLDLLQTEASGGAPGVPQSLSGQLINSTRRHPHVHLRSRPVLGQAQA